MTRIFKYVWKYKLLVIASLTALVVSIALNMINPYLIQILVDRVIKNGETNILTTILISIIVITLLKAILGFIREYGFDYLGTRTNIDMSKDLFEHIQSQSFSFFDGMNTGELMSRISEDLNNIRMAIGFIIMISLDSGVSFIIATVILFTLNWKLTLFSLAVMPLIAYAAMQLEKKIDKAYEKISDHTAVLNTTAQENIAGVRLVKAFAREKHEILKFMEHNKKNYRLNVEQTEIMAKYYPIMEFLSNVCVVLVVSIGGIYVVKENITVGTLVAFNMYIWELIWPMRDLGWLANSIGQTKASAIKVFNVMDTVPEIKDREDAVRLENVEGHIKFENVSFKYNDEYVLKNITLDAKPGTTVAIMGTTGSGKTTLVNLIGRCYEINEGEIFVDGYNVRDVCLRDIRSKMSVVSQDVFLFSETIKENIKIGKEDASMEEIVNACKDACAVEFIDELDEGYETIIGERGIGLSGGQKQRISIARALVRDASILILDDSTSALDTETEYELLKNLNNRSKKATTFIIAHRISAVKNADEILFLDKGKIVERGKHEELLKLKGKYYEVFAEQFKDFEDLTQEVV
ncbi:MAG: ABC-type multidrug transport system, ATPase and permease component [Clostridiales bacterium]|nr:ABC-type multidrug transport system, ATPase and permease component [Clostridiales bacterium]